MTYDGKLLSLARTELEEMHAQNQAEQQRRTAMIYTLLPEIEEIDRCMRTQMTELVRLTLSKPADLQERLRQLERRNLDLQIRRSELLTEKGYPIDYLDEIISCPKCRDTGFDGTGVCECLKKRYNRVLTRELSALLKNGDESFDHFDLSFYPDTPEPESGIIPRKAMEAVYAGCKKFAVNFPDVSSNLLLRGSTGLGNLEAFERQKFSRDPDDAEAASIRVQRMLSCDLMILDDLGTEMVTPMSLSALYTLINSRLNGNLRTIISTNCTDEELERRYTPQICSRIKGEFLELPFCGTDIRQLKRKK